MLTKKGKKVLDFITQFNKENGYSPSLEEVCKKFKLASVSTAHFHIKNLEDSGYLQKEDNHPRSITLFKKEKMVNIPLLGIIAAGQPIEAITENKESIAVSQNKLPKNGKFFALKVAGDSMIDENINDGDIILAKQQNTAENGQKVVALIDNNEATLKKFYKEKDFIKLQPANKNYKPIIIPKNRTLSIQGILIDIIKTNDGEKETIKPFILPPKNEQQSPISDYLNKIIHEDVLVGLKKLPTESCDVIIIDPPYNIGKDFGNNIDKRDLNEYVSWCKNWIDESIRILKPNGTIFIYGFSEILAYLSVEIPINKRWLIWHYTNKNVASLNFWQRSHEAIICAWKNNPIFNRDEIREPYTEGFLNGAAGKIRKGTIGRFSKNGKETIYNAHENGALPRDVIKISALAGGAGMVERWFLCKTCHNVFEPKELKKHLNHKIIKHPTQKPLELSEKLIKSSMPQKNGIILVPFVGSGSECIAAKKLGQNYLGFEINPDYIKIAEERLKKLKLK